MKMLGLSWKGVDNGKRINQLENDIFFIFLIA